MMNNTDKTVSIEQFHCFRTNRTKVYRDGELIYDGMLLITYLESEGKKPEWQKVITEIPYEEAKKLFPVK